MDNFLSTKALASQKSTQLVYDMGYTNVICRFSIFSLFRYIWRVKVDILAVFRHYQRFRTFTDSSGVATDGQAFMHRIPLLLYELQPSRILSLFIRLNILQMYKAGQNIIIYHFGSRYMDICVYVYIYGCTMWKW